MRVLKTVVVACAFAGMAWAAAAEEAVLEYVRATRVQRGRAAYAVDVTVSASVPALSKAGVLRAVKKQAPRGRLTYESLLFQGDRAIKNNVIARFLSAELEAQRPEEKLATEISLLNYRFRLKGREMLDGREALVFEVKPLRRRTGLFRGEVWVDRQTSLPLKEQGKLEKLPSVWVKEITFSREYALLHGWPAPVQGAVAAKGASLDEAGRPPARATALGLVAVPVRITSEVKTRLLGKAFIRVEFTNYRFDETPSPDAVSALGDAPLGQTSAEALAGNIQAGAFCRDCCRPPPCAGAGPETLP